VKNGEKAAVIEDFANRQRRRTRAAITAVGLLPVLHGEKVPAGG